MADSRIPHVNLRSLRAPALAVSAVVLFFGLPGLGGEAVDFCFQSLFWDGKAWLIPRTNALGLALAYDGPKALIIIWAVLLIGAALFAKRVRVRALYLLACLALVAVVCTQLRAVTGIATPLELKAFGLSEPRVPGWTRQRRLRLAGSLLDSEGPRLARPSTRLGRRVLDGVLSDCPRRTLPLAHPCHRRTGVAAVRRAGVAAAEASRARGQFDQLTILSARKGPVEVVASSK